MSDVEFWIARPTQYWAQPTAADADFTFARSYEDAGLDGLLLFDTQNLAPEVYVSLTAAANETVRLHVGTGVTNPTTRHAAVTASAAASLQLVSGGRAYLGIGRGDSALAHIGYSPAPLSPFDRYLQDVQAYLRGEEVDFAADADVDRLNLGDHPDTSQMTWLQNIPKSPVGVAASGPRVISIAAKHADRVDLMLGASRDRVAWGVDVARQARRDAGLDTDVPVSAYINMIVHDDGEAAWQLAAPALTSQSRFAVMHGKVEGPVSEMAKQTLPKIHASYDMKNHGTHGAGVITSEFAHEFGIYGPPAYCVDRLSELAELGIDRFILAGGPDIAMPNPEVAALASRFLTEVLPRFK